MRLSASILVSLCCSTTAFAQLNVSSCYRRIAGTSWDSTQSHSFPVGETFVGTGPWLLSQSNTQVAIEVESTVTSSLIDWHQRQEIHLTGPFDGANVTTDLNYRFSVNQPTWVYLAALPAFSALSGPLVQGQGPVVGSGVSLLQPGEYALGHFAQFSAGSTVGPYVESKTTNLRLEVVPGPCVLPIVTVSPASFAGCSGASVTLTASIQSDPQGELAFQWWKGNPSAPIVGATGPLLTLTGLDSSTDGTYQCVVTNLCRVSGFGTAAVRLCRVDFSCDGVANVQDIFDFLASWFAGDPRSDFNRFGGIGIGDIFDFLTAWFAGCP